MIIEIVDYKVVKVGLETMYWNRAYVTRHVDRTSFVSGGRDRCMLQTGTSRTVGTRGIPGDVFGYIIFGMRLPSRW
jgi:hypothetical protein